MNIKLIVGAIISLMLVVGCGKEKKYVMGPVEYINSLKPVIQGTLTNAGVPKSGVAITLTFQDGTSNQVITDSIGSFKFEALNVGVYSMKVASGSYWNEYVSSFETSRSRKVNISIQISDAVSNVVFTESWTYPGQYVWKSVGYELPSGSTLNKFYVKYPTNDTWNEVATNPGYVVAAQVPKFKLYSEYGSNSISKTLTSDKEDKYSMIIKSFNTVEYILQ